ncbi:hypothetical protein NDU88_004794 [Pleurodeles waltl]|uniref:Uncharacterized protein n=1 Tax=Pleurodeles waltl TaxID=8319 RepID=A0AAV7UGC8_PLEWA|nr:hypothetical protein NDU88_004794 [Pleurodeles waltl]
MHQGSQEQRIVGGRDSRSSGPLRRGPVDNELVKREAERSLALRLAPILGRSHIRAWRASTKGQCEHVLYEPLGRRAAERRDWGPGRKRSLRSSAGPPGDGEETLQRRTEERQRRLRGSLDRVARMHRPERRSGRHSWDLLTGGAPCCALPERWRRSPARVDRVNGAGPARPELFSGEEEQRPPYISDPARSLEHRGRRNWTPVCRDPSGGELWSISAGAQGETGAGGSSADPSGDAAESKRGGAGHATPFDGGRRRVALGGGAGDAIGPYELGERCYALTERWR